MTTTDAEDYVLGTILLTQRVGEVSDIISPDCFKSTLNQEIYKSMLELHANGHKIEYISVIRNLNTKKLKFDRNEVTDITSRMLDKGGNISNIRHYCFLLLEDYLSSKLGNMCNEVTNKLMMNEDFFSTLKFVEQAILDINKKVNSQVTGTDLTTQVNETVLEIKSAMSGTVSGIKTGSSKLDSETGGWHKQNLIVIAGRPGSGKTSRALDFSIKAASQGKRVFIFSVEMSYRELIRKIVSNQTEINSQELLRGQITEDDYKKILKAAESIKQLPLYIYDKAGITTSYIRRIALSEKPDLIVVDYLQILKPEQNKTRSRENEIASISIDLKTIAKETDCPLIVLSQLSRECEKRTDKRPIMSDIRESGQIEQDSDVILGLYRPVYYYPFEKRENQYSNFGIGEYEKASELHILKHRNGTAGIFFEEQFNAATSNYIS